MSTTPNESILDISPEQASVIRRNQLKYVTTLAHVAEHANLNEAEIFPTGDTLRSVAKIADGGIVFNKRMYKLPNTAAIACQILYSGAWQPVDGWKYWSTIQNGEIVSLEKLREKLLDEKMRHGDTISD